MIKDKHQTIAEIESLIENYGLEYQSVGNEIRIYLEKSEIDIIINKNINIYEHIHEKPHSYTSLEEAINKIIDIIS